MSRNARERIEEDYRRSGGDVVFHRDGPSSFFVARDGDSWFLGYLEGDGSCSIVEVDEVAYRALADSWK